MAERYSNMTLILFEDLNMPRHTAKKWCTSELAGYGYDIHMDEGEFQYTRAQ
jgi:hypothetical protein